MFFSLTNSPATFQMMMNDIFKGLIHEGYMVIYMDYILVYTCMIKHHGDSGGGDPSPGCTPKTSGLPQGREVLIQMPFRLSVEYLGLILSEGWVEMDPIKITGVQDWPTLKNVTEGQSFVGFVNSYHRFIPKFSHAASPLHHLTKKVELWQWTEPT